MASKILLRIASLLMLAHLIGHTLGHSGWTKTTDPVKQEVIRQMTEPHFPFMGTSRSFANYYDGFSYASSIGMAMFVAVLWFLGSDSSAGTKLAGQITLCTAFCLLAWGIDELFLFFPFAASFTLGSAGCALVAFYLRSRKTQR